MKPRLWSAAVVAALLLPTAACAGNTYKPTPPEPLPVSTTVKCPVSTNLWGTASDFQLSGFRLKFSKPWLCNDHQDNSLNLAQSAKKAMHVVGFMTGVVEVSGVDKDSLEPDEHVSAQQLISQAYARKVDETQGDWPWLKDLKRLDKFEGKSLRSGGGSSDTVAAWTSTTDHISPENKFLDILVLRDSDSDGLVDSELHIHTVTGNRTKGELKSDQRLAFAVLAAVQPAGQ